MYSLYPYIVAKLKAEATRIEMNSDLESQTKVEYDDEEYNNC